MKTSYTLQLYPSEVYVRQSTLTDVSDLLPLLQQLGYPMDHDMLHERLALYTNAPNLRTFIAQTKGQIVGLIALSIRELFLKSGKVCTIEALVIDEAWRGRKIGTLLVQEAEKYAIYMGCKIIELTSGLRRAKDGTHDFYEHLGYTNTGHYAKLYLRKELA